MIYLLHLDSPFKHAKHYCGWTRRTNLETRLKEHGTKEGSNLLYHVRKAGITWQLVRTWRGGPVQEKLLKRASLARQCPMCRPAYLESKRQQVANYRRRATCQSS